MRESLIEAYLVKQVKAARGEVRKVKWVGRNKAPDRFVMLPPRKTNATMLGNDRIVLPGRTIWVELKAAGGLATFPKNAHEEGQAREHARMRKLGQRVVVIDSYEGVDGLLA